MKYYLISGEASGDLHGSNLIKALKKKDGNAHFRCWGGDLMQAQGVDLVKHYRDLAFMGFVEVLMNLRTILKNISFCKNDIENYRPDVLILIDYPGFNLRIAEWAKQQNIRVVYYISPQVWAWKANRVKKMKTCIDKMLVILPFEKAYYATKWNWEVDYVGHPLVEVIENFRAAEQPASGKKIIALLPGSRKQEIEKKLPVMLEVSRHFPDYCFTVAKAPGQEDAFYDSFLSRYSNVAVTKNATYNLLSHASAALVTSGTATLETALFKVPEIVCYKGNPISYQIAKRLIRIKYISLVNLIMDREVVKELIQDELTTRNLVAELKAILYNSEKQLKMQADYRELKDKLYVDGSASDNAANIIVRFLSEEGKDKKANENYH